MQKINQILRWSKKKNLGDITEVFFMVKTF